MKAIGIVLIVLGLLGLVYQGITYTTREKIIDIGPIEASADVEKTRSIPPLASGAAVLVGLVLIVADRRRA
jgi:Na+-transporting methylmalonyl-CoA/oxaloacetate decarboxylase gamma subunit